MNNETIDIVQEIQQNFLDSSLDVNMNRAFPDIRDGLKPGQRACLWEMYKKKYFSSKPHVKSAKVSGGVIADLWPHGDSAIYETFVRMSQDYTNNIPEIDFHGANGNIILGNDAIAHARYTEVRLSPIVEEGMLKNVEKDCVDMIPNFSDDQMWPRVLPSIFPRLLVNGAQGIGVSLANVWLPHSLTDTANVIKRYINTNEVDNDNYFPDFPTGGTIINSKDLSEINKTGKGKVILEAAYNINGNEINFYEMPYQVYIEPIIEQIDVALTEGKLHNIKGVYNKSDKKHISLVIECEKSANMDKVLAELFAETDLRKQYNANQNGIISKTPILLNLKEVLDVYIEHNTTCIKREYQYNYEKAKARINVLKGLLIALANIDKVIEIIRKSPRVEQELMESFGFDEFQLEAVLGMKLARLSKLEENKLIQEKQEKEELAAYAKKVVESYDEQKRILVERLEDLVKKFGDDRRTRIEDKAIVKVNGKAKEVAEIIPEDIVVMLNADGYLKSIPVKNFKIAKRKTAGITLADKIIDTIKTNTVDMLMLFSNKGKMYRISANDIAQCGMSDKGTAVGAILKLEQGERIMLLSSIGVDNNYQYVAFFTKNGLFKKTDKSEFIGDTRNLRGIKAITIKDGDEIQNIAFINEEDVIMMTYAGNAIRFDSSLVSPTGKTAAGVKGMNIGDSYVSASLVVRPETAKILIATEDGYGKRVPLINFTPQTRGGKGAKCGEGIIGADAVVDEDMVMLIGSSKNITLKATAIPEASKNAKGNKLIKSGTIKQICKL